jgi:hypothetical protein
MVRNQFIVAFRQLLLNLAPVAIHPKDTFYFPGDYSYLTPEGV